MINEKTSLTSSTSVSFDKSDTDLDIKVEIVTVTQDDQSCDEVFFDVFVTKNLEVDVKATAGTVALQGDQSIDFIDFLSFNDSNEASFNHVGVVGDVELEVVGSTYEIITKENKQTGKKTKTSKLRAVSFIFDTDSQKIITASKINVFGLVKATGTKKSKRYRWTGPNDSKHVVYALHEASGANATLEVDIQDCKKDPDSGENSNKPNSHTLSLGVEMTDFVVADGLTIGSASGYPTYPIYGSFIVWPVPSFASLYALFFNSAGMEAFDWGDLEISREDEEGHRPQAELLSFSNSETASLQYAPLGDAVSFSILGDFVGKYESNQYALGVGLKGPGETVYRRTYKTVTTTDPVTKVTTTTTIPVDKSVKVGPTEIYCVDAVNNVIVKGQGKAVAKYSCPARSYNFKLEAAASAPFWTKWNCQVAVGYEQTDITFGLLVSNGGFSVPSPFERLVAMRNFFANQRYDRLKAAGYSHEFIIGT